MDDDPRGTSFEPRYHPLLWLALSLPVLFGLAVAGSSLVLHGSLVGASIAMVIFILPPLLLFGHFLWFRHIELRRGALHLSRPVFRDARVAYDEVRPVGAAGASAGGRFIVWKFMRNGDELYERFLRLGRLESVDGMEFAVEPPDEGNVRKQLVPISSGIFLGLSAGLAAAGMDLGSTLLAAAVGTGVAYAVLMRTMGEDGSDEGG